MTTDSVQRLLGWTPDDLIGTPFVQLVHPADALAVRGAQERLRDRQEAAFDVRLRRVDGTYRWMSIRVRPIISDTGELMGRLASWHDIQAQVEARDLHHRRIHRLTAALESMVDPYACCEAVRDPHGRITDFVIAEANSAATTHFGVPLGTLVGTLTSSLLPADGFERLLSVYAGVLATGEPFFSSGVTATTGSGAGTAEFDVSISRVDATTVSTTWRNVSARVELLSLRATVVASEAAAEERRHIARDLHDGLLQQILASGMLASSLLPLLGAEAAEVGERIVVLHDAQVRQLRTMMLDLADGATAPRGLVGEVRGIVAEAGAALGFEPSLSVLGDLDTVGEIVGEHLAYSLRETSRMRRGMRTPRASTSASTCSPTASPSPWPTTAADSSTPIRRAAAC